MIDFPNDPRGRELRALVDRLRFERWLGGEVDQLLTREFTRLVDLLVSSKYRDLTPDQRQRAAQLFREIEKRLKATYSDVAQLHVDQMRAYAVVEAEFAARGVEALYEAAGTSLSIGVNLPKTYLESIAKLPIQGLNIGDWFDRQAAAMTSETKRIIQQGLVEGKGPLQIASRISASDKAAGPVLSRRARSEARTISRTVVNAVQNDAQFQQLRRLPPSVSDSWVWESVLDGRTSQVCISRSGRVYRYDDPRAPHPPAHPNCRSSQRALLKGIDEPLADQKTPRTMRNYESWLKERSVTDQNDILGRGRAELWRSGKMSLADAINADGRVMTLKELRASLLERETVGA